MRSQIGAPLIALAAVAMLAVSSASAAPRDEIRSTFGKFVAAQNAHNLKAVGDLLSDSPDFIWIAPGRIVRGRDAAIQRFGELFQGAWRVDPDWSTFHIRRTDSGRHRKAHRHEGNDAGKGRLRRQGRIQRIPVGNRILVREVSAAGLGGCPWPISIQQGFNRVRPEAVGYGAPIRP